MATNKQLTPGALWMLARARGGFAMSNLNHSGAPEVVDGNVCRGLVHRGLVTNANWVIRITAEGEKLLAQFDAARVSRQDDVTNPPAAVAAADVLLKRLDRFLARLKLSAADPDEEAPDRLAWSELESAVAGYRNLRGTALGGGTDGKR